MSLVTATCARAPDDRLRIGGCTCSLWWSGTPRHPHHRVGAIGEIVASDAAALTALLGRACKRLAAQGCTLAIGPMDGTTWGRYRAVTGSPVAPPFFLEPQNAPYLPACFEGAGFRIVARYVSAIEEPIACAPPPRSAALVRQAQERGIRTRALDTRDFHGELRRLHGFCLAAFRSSFLFTPIDADRFVEINAPLAPCIRPELARVAEEDGRIVALLFALPDALEALRGAPPCTVIVKTIATLPERRNEGLARLLADEVAANARALGFRRAIHALMHEANRSAAWSAKAAGVFRRYALFARPLARPAAKSRHGPA